jgi:hypothetical protein
MKEIVNANGGIVPAPEPVSPDGKYRLRELIAIVGGYIQIVPAKDGRVAVLNEEAKVCAPGDELPDNPTATEMIELLPGDKIVGAVLFCNSEDID